jgi:hypothetical protein
LNQDQENTMNKALFSLIGYSGSLVAVLSTATVASPDYRQTIPFPQVINLQRVPIFNAQGIVPQNPIAQKKSVRQEPIQRAMDWHNRTPAQVAIKQLNCKFPGCQNPPHQILGSAINF